mmetsp:Transcript_15157/g.31191  ORF Transcript_15157/g.31191 Transcript_15157/m.31191 type:complete len:208 (+) Transcript_15157:1195-1818(+)
MDACSLLSDFVHNFATILLYELCSCLSPTIAKGFCQMPLQISDSRTEGLCVFNFPVHHEIPNQKNAKTRCIFVALDIRNKSNKPRKTTALLKAFEQLLLRFGQRLAAVFLSFHPAKVVEVSGIERVGNPRLPWRFELAGVEPVEVQVLEPGVVLDIKVAAAQVTKTRGLASRQEFLDDVLGIVAHVGGALVLHHDDALEETNLIGAV